MSHPGIDTLEKLLQLYCEHATKEIEGADGKLLLDHFGVDEPSALMAIDGYPEAFGVVSTCASFLDCLVSDNPAPSDQVLQALRAMRGLIDDGEPARKIEVLRQLVERRLYYSWQSDAQEIYDRKKQILEWRDFFVSYTNRDAPAINQQFRDLIRSSLGTVPRGNAVTSNYLARVITRHLRRYQGLTGFFDEDNLKVGENIHDGVDGFCTKAFALVQLIEPLSFDKEPPRNWCFHEYKKFSSNPAIVSLLGNKDRHFFILTDSQLTALQPASPFPPYSAWHTHIQNLKHTHISLHGERNSTLRAKIKNIASEILALRTEIIDAWLS